MRRNSSARARDGRGGMVLGEGGGGGGQGWFLRGMVLQFCFFGLVFVSVYIQKKTPLFLHCLKSKF